MNLLAAETPADLVAFDVVALRGQDLRPAPFTDRRAALAGLIPGLEERWHLTPSTTDRAVAARWFDDFEAAGCDGIVAKRLDGPYVEEKREMVKVKHRRTVDCVVGGYRVHKDGEGIGSILLGLYDGPDLHFIGHCSGFPDHDRKALLAQFEKIKADDSFGPEDEVRRPGGESRWTGDKDLSWVPVTPGVVVEVSYDQLTGARFRHATRFERWRPDKDAIAVHDGPVGTARGPGVRGRGGGVDRRCALPLSAIRLPLSARGRAAAAIKAFDSFQRLGLIRAESGERTADSGSAYSCFFLLLGCTRGGSPGILG